MMALNIPGLREIEWAKFSMKTSASLVASGKMSSAHAPEYGGVSQWSFQANTNGCSTHTDSPVFALWKRYAASSAIPKRESSPLFAAQKNRLQRLWPDAHRLVRQKTPTGTRPLLWRYAHLSGNRDQTGVLSALRQSETGTTRLSRRQPALYQAVCLVCRQALPRQHGVGHRPRTASGLAYREGTGQAIHDGTTGTCRNPGTQGHRHRRNLDPQRAHLSHRGQRPGPWTPHLVWRTRPLGGQHAAIL